MSQVIYTSDIHLVRTIVVIPGALLVNAAHDSDDMDEGSGGRQESMQRLRTSRLRDTLIIALRIKTVSTAKQHTSARAHV